MNHVLMNLEIVETGLKPVSASRHSPADPPSPEAMAGQAGESSSLDLIIQPLYHPDRIRFAAVE